MTVKLDRKRQESSGKELKRESNEIREKQNRKAAGKGIGRNSPKRGGGLPFSISVVNEVVCNMYSYHGSVAKNPPFLSGSLKILID